MQLTATLIDGVALGQGWYLLEFTWKGELVRMWIDDCDQATFVSSNTRDSGDLLSEWGSASDIPELIGTDCRVEITTAQVPEYDTIGDIWKLTLL